MVNDAYFKELYGIMNRTKYKQRASWKRKQLANHPFYSRGRNQIRARKVYPVGRPCIHTYTTSTTTMNVGTVQQQSVGHNIVKGTDLGNRAGDRIFINKINIKLTLYNPNAGSTDVGRMRFTLAENLRPGTLPTTNMWATETDAQTPIDYAAGGDVTQLLKQWNPLKFKVKFDRLFPVKVLGVSDTGPKAVVFNKTFVINRYFTFNNEAAGDDRVLPDMTFMEFVENDDSGAGFTVNLTKKMIITTYFTDA